MLVKCWPKLSIATVWPYGSSCQSSHLCNISDPISWGNGFFFAKIVSFLIWLSNFKEPEGQLAKWLERLQEYDFVISHRPGQRHQNADVLSRRHRNTCGRDTHFDTTPQIIAAEQASAPALTEKSPNDLKQLADGPNGLLLRAMEAGKNPYLMMLGAKDLSSWLSYRTGWWWRKKFSRDTTRILVRTLYDCSWYHHPHLEKRSYRSFMQGHLKST